MSIQTEKRRKLFFNLVEDIEPDLLTVILETPKEIINIIHRLAQLRQASQFKKVVAYHEFKIKEVSEWGGLIDEEYHQICANVKQSNEEIISQQTQILETINDPIITRWLYDLEYDVKLLSHIPNP